MQGVYSDKKKFILFEIFLIILFWLLIFASPLFLGHTNDGFDWNHIFKVWKERSVLLLLFIANRFILVPLLFLKHRRILYLIIASLLVGTATTGLFFYYQKPSPGMKDKPVSLRIAEDSRNNGSDLSYSPDPAKEAGSGYVEKRPEPIPAYINLLIYSLLLFGFDTGLKTISKWVFAEQQRIILEKENMENQLAFLKSQVSPHFFMNTMNNIHALIDIDPVEAKKSVIKLSGLMSYLLYESDQPLCPLKREVDFITSYVSLMKLRYSGEVTISLSIPEKLPEKSVPPLLFISLLENAFKYGISYMHDSFVKIELSISDTKLRLFITNSINRGKVRQSGKGIGIENTRKRLDLIFREKYSLETTDMDNIFTTCLIIPLL